MSFMRLYARPIQGTTSSKSDELLCFAPEFVFGFLGDGCKACWSAGARSGAHIVSAHEGEHGMIAEGCEPVSLYPGVLRVCYRTGDVINLSCPGSRPEGRGVAHVQFHVRPGRFTTQDS